MNGSAVSVFVDFMREGLSFFGFWTRKADEVAVAGAKLQAVVLNVSCLERVGDSGAFLVGIISAWLGAVLFGEWEAEAEGLENFGIFQIDVAAQGLDFVSLLKAEIIHIFTGSNFDFFAVIFCVFAHNKSSLDCWVKGGGDEAVKYKSEQAENGDVGSVVDAKCGAEAEGGD